jgi:hypothetical protein
VGVFGEYKARLRVIGCFGDVDAQLTCTVCSLIPCVSRRLLPKCYICIEMMILVVFSSGINWNKSIRDMPLPSPVSLVSLSEA